MPIGQLLTVDMNIVHLTRDCSTKKLNIFTLGMAELP